MYAHSFNLGAFLCFMGVRLLDSVARRGTARPAAAGTGFA